MPALSSCHFLKA